MKCYWMAGLLIMAACQSQPDGFVLKGQFSGADEKQWVYLTDIDQNTVYDSTQMQNGKFEFRGKLPVPELRCLTIYKNNNERDSWETMIALPVFLENTAMRVSAPYAELPTKIKRQLSAGIRVEGSAVHDLYAGYMNDYTAWYDTYSNLYNRYASAYYYHKGTPEDVFRYVGQIDSLREQIFRLQCGIIAQYPESPVAVYVAENMNVERYGREEARKLTDGLPQQVKDSENGKKLVRLIQEKPLYLNDSLPHIRLLSLQPDTLLLKNCLQPGHYTLVEFWASWCGPCRSDIPHLKETYQRYHDKGFDIISISIDDEPEAWNKAVSEEKMPWTQLCDWGGEGFNKNGIRAFGVNGVPSGFLVDPDGKVIHLKARGGWLDMKLAELLD